MKLVLSMCVCLLFCGLIAPIAQGAESRICFGERTTITDGARSSRIVGTAGRDVIDAGAGSDTVLGRGGSDLICGNFGDDLLYGGRGNDKLNGGRNTGDVVEGGPGNDYMEGDDESCCADLAGADTVSFRTARGPVTVDLRTDQATGQGTDTVVGFGQIDGSDFDDRLIADFVWPSAAIRGFAGDDVIIGFDGPEDLEEVFLGGKGNDTINGRDGIDLMVGGLGADTLHGGLSNNNFGEVVGDEVLYGGFLITNGWLWQGNGLGSVTVDLRAGTATGRQGNDTLSGIEDITGSIGDDTLRGDAHDNSIGGNDGFDRVNGRGGTDSCDGEVVRNCEVV